MTSLDFKKELTLAQIFRLEQIIKLLEKKGYIVDITKAPNT